MLRPGQEHGRPGGTGGPGKYRRARAGTDGTAQA
ncbi:hypothetical protein YWIDRAFT_02215 [Streptomyces sp. SceaMP-e96]|nr:hypothetical protein YWIDRAFT_02215 [Streptomyces sp. SceaMP-e96]